MKPDLQTVNLNPLHANLECVETSELAPPGGCSCSCPRPLARRAVHPLANRRMLVDKTHMLELVASPELRKFGQDKRDTLTQQCQQCEVRPLHNGGCPKDCFALSKDGEVGHNYLCDGLYNFFSHTRPAMQRMAQLYANRGRPAEVMDRLRDDDRKRDAYAACPCGSAANSAPAKARARTGRPLQDGHRDRCQRQSQHAAGRTAHGAGTGAQFPGLRAHADGLSSCCKATAPSRSTAPTAAARACARALQLSIFVRGRQSARRGAPGRPFRPPQPSSAAAAAA